MTTKTRTPKAPEKGGLKFTPSGHRYRMSQQPGVIGPDNKFLPVSGVTTLLGGGIPKPALVRWAPKVVAEWVADPANRAALDQLLAGDQATAIRELKELPTKERDAAGVRGTAVHAHAETLHSTGEAPDVPEDLLSFVEGYVDFLDRFQITAVLAERPVGNRKDWWAGTFDLFATSPLLMTAEDIAAGNVIQIDLKTSKGVYGETALQTAAYAEGEFYMDDNGDEQPLPEVVATYVAHVTPLDRDGENARYDGWPLGTSLYQLAKDRDEIKVQYGQFLAAAYTHKMTKYRDGIITDPITIAITEQEAA